MIRSLARSRIDHLSARAVAVFLIAVACTGQQSTPAGTTPTATFGIGGLASVGVEGHTAVLYNGKISVLDAGNNVVQAIAIRDGKVLAVGTTDQVKNAAGSGAQLIDLGGRVVIPGLIDGTLHDRPWAPSFARSRSISKSSACAPSCGRPTVLA